MQIPMHHKNDGIPPSPKDVNEGLREKLINNKIKSNRVVGCEDQALVDERIPGVTHTPGNTSVRDVVEALVFPSSNCLLEFSSSPPSQLPAMCDWRESVEGIVVGLKIN